MTVDAQFVLKTKGGGVSIFVKHNIEFIHREDLSLSTPTIECIFIEIKHENKMFLLLTGRNVTGHRNIAWNDNSPSPLLPLPMMAEQFILSTWIFF